MNITKEKLAKGFAELLLRPLMYIALTTVIIMIIALITSIITSRSFPFSIGMFSGGQTNWIGFYGSVISGVFTVFGVKLTIDHNRKISNENMVLYKEQFEKQQRNSIKPFFYIKELTTTQDSYDIHRLYYVEENKEKKGHSYARLSLELTNQGRGISTNSMMYIKLSNSKKMKEEFFDIPKQTVARCDLVFDVDIITEDYENPTEVEMCIEFQDMIGTEYKQTIKLKIYKYEGQGGFYIAKALNIRVVSPTTKTLEN